MRALVLSLAVALFNISNIAKADNFIPDQLNVVNNIKDAFFNEKSQELQVELSYVGGCMDHEFELRVNKCYEEDQNNVCYLDVVRVAGFEDSCKRIVNDEVIFPVDYQFIEVNELVIGNVSVKL